MPGLTDCLPSAVAQGAVVPIDRAATSHLNVADESRVLVQLRVDKACDLLVGVVVSAAPRRSMTVNALVPVVTRLGNKKPGDPEGNGPIVAACAGEWLAARHWHKDS